MLKKNLNLIYLKLTNRIRLLLGVNVIGTFALLLGVEAKATSWKFGLLKNCDGLNETCLIGLKPFLTGVFPEVDLVLL